MIGYFNKNLEIIDLFTFFPSFLVNGKYSISTSLSRYLSLLFLIIAIASFSNYFKKFVNLENFSYN